ncbi:MAG: 2,3-bisphosphoglycerate-independent phosphoglycerate mutase, partial [bacterium]
VPAWTKKGGTFIITADHGNADEMSFHKEGKNIVSTQHSLNPVPFWVLGKAVKLKETGIIPDVGVTILDLLELPKANEMTAQSLRLK